MTGFQAGEDSLPDRGYGGCMYDSSDDSAAGWYADAR